MWINDEVRARLAAHTAATEARLSETQAENGELRAKLVELRAEQAAHTAHLSDIHASTSWRLSAPVRLAGREAGRLSQRVRRGRVPRPADGRTDSPSDPPPPAAEAAEPEQSQSDSPQPAAEAGRPPYGQSDPLLLAAEAGRLEYRPLISILVPVYDTPPRYLRLAVDSVLAQAYPEWELILCDDGSTNAGTRAALEEIARLDPRIRVQYLGVNSGIAAATNAALAMAQGELVAMLDHDDELLPAALLEVVKALNADRTLDVVYTDQDSIEADGTVAHTFYKPDWSLELLRGVMYVGHLLVVRRSLADEVGGFDPAFDGVQDFELMLRLAEHTERIAHVPAILYHWRKIPGSVALGGREKRDIDALQAAAVNAHLERCGVAAVARSNPELEHRLLIAPQPRTRRPLVSVVVRAAGAEADLEACCASILASKSYPRRQIIVTGGDIPRDLGQRLEALGVVFEAPGESGSAAVLAGLQRAAGELIVSMAGDLEVQTPDWLEHLLYECELPRVACVTPLILSYSGEVASAGLILGGEDAVAPAMRRLQPGADGYAGSLSCVREVSAAPGDCYAVTRAVWGLLGGLSPYYAGDDYQAVDFSLRAFSRGLRNLCTPRVVVRHRGPALRDGRSDALDELLLADAWEALIEKGDPFHNRNFAQVAPGYRA
jgi:GT2 family glycosyltransferase